MDKGVVCLCYGYVGQKQDQCVDQWQVEGIEGYDVFGWLDVIFDWVVWFYWIYGVFDEGLELCYEEYYFGYDEQDEVVLQFDVDDWGMFVGFVFVYYIGLLVEYDIQYCDKVDQEYLWFFDWCVEEGYVFYSGDGVGQYDEGIDRVKEWLD